jgi:hypothetical protein
LTFLEGRAFLPPLVRSYLKTDMKPMYQILADGMLFLHVLFVVFVLAGQFLIVTGGCLGWAWIRNWWFRICHLGAIAMVVVQSWLGLICPLTLLEMRLREHAGQEPYEGSFIQFWLERLLYHEAPAWVFIAAYTVFGLLVVITWFRLPPHKTTPTKGRN